MNRFETVLSNFNLRRYSMGKDEEGFEMCEDVRKEEPSDDTVISTLDLFYRMSGRRAEMISLFEAGPDTPNQFLSSTASRVPALRTAPSLPCIALLHSYKLSYPVPRMTKCVTPLKHCVRPSAKSSRATNQNAAFGRLSTTCC
jgi:hypothetical protein